MKTARHNAPYPAHLDHEISQAKPQAYEAAGHDLKKIKAVYSQENNIAAWTHYMAELRECHKRRPRMLGVLDALEGQRKRIVS